MANRTDMSRNQPFDGWEVASAIRISKLLAPFLYILQHRSEFGAEQRIKVVQSLFMGMGHELRTPIAKLGWECDHLQTSAVPEQQHHLERIRTYITEFNNMIESLRQIATQDPGKPEQVDLCLAFNNIWSQILSHKPEFGNIIFFNTIPKRTWVRIDPNQLKRILNNLLKNSCEALNRKEKAQIVAKCLPNLSTPEVVFTVSDNGPGVPPSIHDRLFLPFITGHENAVSAVGYPGRVRGLGLTIVMLAVENAGGSVRLLPQPTGACFEIVLPAI